MNASDILKYGHLLVLKTINPLTADQWQTPNVCGVWSCQQIMAHLASYEQLLIDILTQMNAPDIPTPTLDVMLAKGPYGFNDVELEKRASHPLNAILAEYKTGCERTMTLIASVPVETRRQLGILKWYGGEYDLEDFLVYTYYGHKREHMGQIEVFKDSLKH